MNIVSNASKRVIRNVVKSNISSLFKIKSYKYGIRRISTALLVKQELIGSRIRKGKGLYCMTPILSKRCGPGSPRGRSPSKTPSCIIVFNLKVHKTTQINVYIYFYLIDLNTAQSKGRSKSAGKNILIYNIFLIPYIKIVILVHIYRPQKKRSNWYVYIRVYCHVL